ncbi:MAG: peptide chain release factor N(5)-glutamine methyltransferase [Spirochaetota bacterium]
MQKDTVLYVLTKSREYLEKKQIANPRLDAEVLLAHVLQMERIRLYTNYDMVLNESEKDAYRSLLKERATFRPIAYIIGKKDFYDLSFYVDERVLIPRPETEELVELFFKSLHTSQENAPHILDLCSGSGCIGLSIKHKKPDAHVTLCDISADALTVSTKNASKIFGDIPTNLDFQQDNLGETLNSASFDYIISNPPYIPIEEKAGMMPDVVNFEPEQALFLQEPKSFYEKLLSSLQRLLKPNGEVFIECHSKWTEYLQDISKNYGFTNIRIILDLSEKSRFLHLS